MGQTNDVIAQVGTADQERHRSVRRLPRAADHADGHVGVERHGAQLSRRSRRTCAWPNGGPIFDGFLLTSTNGNTPLPIVDVPMIQMPTQTEVVTWAEKGIAYRRPDSDEPGNRFRLYEVAGMPHNNSRDSPGFQNDPCTLPVTDFPAGAFTALGAELPGRVDRQRQDAAARAADRRRSEHRRTTARTWRSTSTATPRAASATSGWTCRSRPTACSGRARRRRRIGCASSPARKCRCRTRR